MKILGISGSPNLNGNTSFAVRHALGFFDRSGHETRFVSLAGKTLKHCIACGRCGAKGVCHFDDDMGDILSSMRWCDGLVLGTPVYMGLVSGQLKTFMDRCVPLRPSYEKPLEMNGKLGAGIACAGFRNGGQELALQNIHTFLLQQSMLAVNDGQPFSHSGGAIAGKAQDDELGLKTVENVAKHMMSVLSSRTS
jgi:multimeric flavodoxin WrbA